jgi:transcriptional regulator with XRE-family HTH domain
MKDVPKIRQVELVGRKIRELRKERRLTQTELSAKIGVQQSDLSRMEKGEYRVSLDTLFRILGEFQIGVGEFFDEIAREALAPRELKVIQEYQSLAPDAQREVEDFIAFKRGQSGGRETHTGALDGATRADGGDASGVRRASPPGPGGSRAR